MWTGLGNVESAGPLVLRSEMRADDNGTECIFIIRGIGFVVLAFLFNDANRIIHNDGDAWIFHSLHRLD